MANDVTTKDWGVPTLYCTFQVLDSPATETEDIPQPFVR